MIDKVVDQALADKIATVFADLGEIVKEAYSPPRYPETAVQFAEGLMKILARLEKLSERNNSTIHDKEPGCDVH
jgi:hypothetical protein